MCGFHWQTQNGLTGGEYYNITLVWGQNIKYFIFYLFLDLKG